MYLDRLKRLCSEGASTRKIAKDLEVSQTTVRYYLNKYGLKTRLSKDHECDCGVTGAENFHKGRLSVCRKCANSKRMKRSNDRRVYALTKLGNKCLSCGFDKYPCSLDIHHTDPSIKDTNFDGARAWSVERIDRELETCVLLCKNCHAALHAGHPVVY